MDIKTLNSKTNSQHQGQKFKTTVNRTHHIFFVWYVPYCVIIWRIILILILILILNLILILACRIVLCYWRNFPCRRDNSISGRNMDRTYFIKVDKKKSTRGTSRYDYRCRILNSLGKYRHYTHAQYRSEFGLLLDIWHFIGFGHRLNMIKELKIHINESQEFLFLNRKQ